MPRSTKASSRPSVTSKRTSKRNTSVQKDVYSIPESPQSSVVSANEDASRSMNEADHTSVQTSPHAPCDRGRSMSTTSTKIGDNLDSTLTQARKPRSRAVSLEPHQSNLPGFEALEAVNGLYQKLKDAQTDIARLKQENARLVGEAQNQDKELQRLQAEVHVERDKAKKAQQIQNKDDLEARRIAEDNLSAVLVSLQNFSSAAYGLMPLLDVLTDAPDFEYDEATERLYQIMKQYREKSGSCEMNKPTS